MIVETNMIWYLITFRGETNVSFELELYSSDRINFDVLENPFDEGDSIINICSGKEATPAIRDDITNALKIGENALDIFWKDQLKSKKVVFYATIRKSSLKSFKTLEVKKAIKLKDKSVIIAAERTIFARFLALAQSQGALILKQIFCFLLSPIPWVL